MATYAEAQHAADKLYDMCDYRDDVVMVGLTVDQVHDPDNWKLKVYLKAGTGGIDRVPLQIDGVYIDVLETDDFELE